MSFESPQNAYDLKTLGSLEYFIWYIHILSVQPEAACFATLQSRHREINFLGALLEKMVVWY